MTQVLLVRHGEPRYDEVENRGFKALGREFGKLTEAGEKQALERASDPRFKDAELIIASPYTRALQTAAIISRITNIPLTVEHDIHEWMIDKSQSFPLDGWHPLWVEYDQNKGVRKEDSIYPWESFAELKKRVDGVLNRYKHYKKIIVVCHGFAMSTQTFFRDDIEYCGVREITI